MELTVEIIHLESVRILGFVPYWYFYNLAILISDFGRRLLDDLGDNLWVFLR